MRSPWHKHQIARRERDIGGQARTFSAKRIFHHLHHQILPLTNQFRDVAHRELLLFFTRHTFGVRHDVGCMKKRGFIQPNIYKSRLHTRKYTTYTTLVDIAYYSASRLTFNMNFLQNTAINIRHSRFRRRYVY